MSFQGSIWVKKLSISLFIVVLPVIQVDAHIIDDVGLFVLLKIFEKPLTAEN